MFGLGSGRIKPGEYVFVVQKEQDYNRLIIGVVQSITGNRIQVRGT